MPGLVGVTVIVTVAVASAGRVPRVQVTVPSLFLFGSLTVRVQAPWLADTEPNTALAGSGSVTFTPVASCPPGLAAWRV